MSITKELTYQKSHIETMESSRIIALAQVHKLIFDELAGHFIVDKAFRAYQFSKTQLSVYAAGIVIPELIEERWNGTKLHLTLQTKVDREEAVSSIIFLFKDREKMEELEETGKNIEGASKELKKLQNNQPARYFFAVDLLNRERLMESGYALRNIGKYEESIELFSRLISLKRTQRIPKQKGYIGRVIAYAANLRAEPSLDSRLVGYIDKGKSLTIMGEGKDAHGINWYKVKRSKGKEVWIRGDVVQVTKQNVQVGTVSGSGEHYRARAYAGRASVYLKNGKPDKAIHDCDKAIMLKPGFARAYNYRGVSYTHLGNYQKSIEDFNKVIKLEPNKVAGYINRGFAYTEMEDFQKAKKDLDRAIHMEPRNEFAYPNRGRLYAKSGDFQQAIKDYDKALMINPRFGVAFVGRGIAYAVSRDYEKAIQDLTAAIELEPKNADAICSRGSVYLNMGETGKAIEDYKVAAGLGDKDARDYLKGKGIPWYEK